MFSRGTYAYPMRFGHGVDDPIAALALALDRWDAVRGA